MDIFFALILNKIGVCHINSVLENGTCPKSKMKNDEFIPKPQISATLNKKGCHIYVDIPSDFEKFGKAFGKSINLSFIEETSITLILLSKILSKFGITNDKTIIQWESVMEIFRNVSAAYKAKHGKPLVIIYDNINRLVKKKNPKILDILQEAAKRDADESSYIACLGNTIEIGDLDLIGGRILQLKSEADKLQQGKPFEAIKEKMFTKIEDDFKNAKLFQNQVHHEVGKNVIKTLLNFKEIKYMEFLYFFNTNKDAKEVLDKNVFAYHPGKNTS
ncbi:1672_t:CDS:2 [Diversispora eburnea]|uniref:1672_t:CDS:1 n=1 Tax=Diversispora eburnea TaxID=1213867 RepID=A0A9N8Z2J8_9GLOM|nr:1672_t:CDS:2 [Diversispora eburnea]